jgi:electron transfer flavoprotein alpha subunit
LPIVEVKLLQKHIICYIPVEKGSKLTKTSWGLIQEAIKLKKQTEKTIGIVVHNDMNQDSIISLPFDAVFHIQIEDHKWKVAQAHLQILESFVKEHEISNAIYLFSSHPLYHEIAVRLSVKLEAGIITNAMQIEYSGDADLTIKKEIYHGKAHQNYVFSHENHRIITMQEMFLFEERIQGKPQKVEQLNVKLTENNQLRFSKETLLGWQDLKITEARCVIGIGRGVYGSSIDDILRLADLLNAPLGGSKVADELGLIPRDKRIGSSGSFIDADIYITIGISGSSQHLEGIKNVKHVIAVNNDPSAPIFQRAAIGIIGDFEVVIPQLVRFFQEERQREVDDQYMRSS